MDILPSMSGHSKWSTIKHQKGKTDALRGKLFSKLAREITVAAKMGDPNPAMNPRLRLAVATAKANSMPKDNIEKAIAKGAGNSEGENYEDVRYEGYGPGGVAVVVEALTDNRNRTAADVRACLAKNGGNLGETGCVGYMFDRVGEIVYLASAGSAEEVFERALEAGAQDVESDAQGHIILTAIEDFTAVRDALEASLGAAERAGLIWRPNMTALVTEEGQAKTLLKMIDILEDNDDVQHITTNAEFDEALLKILME